MGYHQNFLHDKQAAICYNYLTMSQATPIDITNMPELVRIAEEVEATKKPRELVRDNKLVAVITPMLPTGKANKRKAKTKADYEAFKRAAGSWSDVDTDTLIKRTNEGVTAHL